MLDDDLHPDTLEPELARVNAELGEVLRQLANLNDPFGRQILPGEPVSAAVPTAFFTRVLKTLPDGAGTEAFLKALLAAWGPPRKPPPPPTSAGA